MYSNWRSFCGIFTLAASLAMLGCGNGSTSNVRAVNASPGFAPFTFQAGQIGFASGLPYGTEGVQPKGDNYTVNDTTGNYRIVAAGVNQTLSTFAVPGTSLVATKLTLLKSTSYTVVSIGASPTMGLAVLTDDDSAPPSGQFKMRFANYSGYSGVDVYITAVGASPSGNPTIGNAGFNNPVYLPLAPGTFELQITPHANQTTTLATAPFSPAAGSIYSVFFVDPNVSQPPPNSDLTGYGISIINDPISTTATK